MLIHQYIEAHSIHQEDAFALKFRQCKLTYGQLNQQANQLAYYLNSLGIGSKARVAVCLEPSLEVAVSLLAIFKSGSVYVPLDPSYPLERLETILTEVKPKILITQSHLISKLETLEEHIFCIDHNWEAIQNLPKRNIENKIHLNQTAYIIYTSGTTGKPKGVMVSHSNLLHYILSSRETYGFNSQDVMPAIARFTFSISLFELLSPLVAGGTLIILERDSIFDFEQMIQVLDEVTLIHAGPSLFRSLISHIEKRDINPPQFKHLRHVSTGGDMVSIDILERMKKIFQYAEIFVIYGCSESSCMSCSYAVPREKELTKSFVGRPFKNVYIHLFDEYQNQVQVENIGEIYIGGEGVSQGYLYRQELTQSKFMTIGGVRFYRTGDIGRVDKSGNLEVLGRNDFQIKIRGIRIETQEIELVLNNHLLVKESLVMAKRVCSGDPHLIAYIVKNHDRVIKLSEIREYLSHKLPDFMIPNAFIFLKEIPLNFNGKKDRLLLPSPEKSDYIDEVYIAPRNNIEQQLVFLWEKHLGHHSIGINDNFFELGGNSLSSVNLILEVEEMFNHQFPLESFSQLHTIEKMALWIRDNLGQKKELDNTPIGLSQNEYRALLFHSAGRIGKHIGKRGLIIETSPIEMRSSNPFVWIGDINVSKELDLKQPVYTMPANSWEPLHFPNNYISVIASLLVDELLSVQPTGTYTIGAYCFEGLVALEMAQQLQQRGKEVGLLVLIDKFGPSAFYHYMGKLDRYLNVLRFELFQLLTLSLSPIEKWRYIKKRLQRRAEFKMFIPQQGEALIKHKTIATLYEASNSYTPQVYSGRVVLIKSTKTELRIGKQDLFESDCSWLFPYFGWEGLFTGKVEAHKIPCKHLEVYVNPYIKDIGRLLENTLSEM